MYVILIKYNGLQEKWRIAGSETYETEVKASNKVKRLKEYDAVKAMYAIAKLGTVKEIV